jgi:hypothetical protein
MVLTEAAARLLIDQVPLLRGLITQAITDAQARGYDQGVARGRRLIANAVRDALEGEGL